MSNRTVNPILFSFSGPAPGRVWLLSALVLLLGVLPLCAQGEEQEVDTTLQDEVKSAIAKLDSGFVEEAKNALPGLISRYQQNADLLYLRGRLAENGIEAVKFYQVLVANFPSHEWADDALYRVYQYYYAMGLYRTADAKLQQMRKDYPESPYLAQVSDTSKGKKESQDPPRSKSGELIVGGQQQPATKLPPPLPPKPHNQEERKQEERTSPVPAGKYTLQVGAFSTRANAEKQRKVFDQRGYPTEIVERPVGRKTLFIVHVGAYATAEEARRAGTVIRNEQRISSMVVER